MTSLPTDEMVLTLGGTRWRGWTEIAVTRSIEAAAGTFELTLTDKAGTPDTPLRLDVRPGTPCRVEVEGPAGREVLITGHVDDVEPSFSADDHSVRIAGRDAAGDLVDCSAIHEPSGEFHGANALQIASALAKPFGVTARAAVDVGGPFRSWRIQEGETVWECIERACRCRGLLCVSDGHGGIVLTRAAAAIRTGVTLGRRDLIGGRGTFSLRDRHSRITAKGQSAMEDGWTASAVAAPAATVTDAGVPRHRPLVVLAEDLAEGQTLDDRAGFEAAVRVGRARRVEVTRAGWRDPVGALWRPLALVTIEEEWLALNAAMLIAGVTFTRNASQGSRTALTLVGPKAFEVLPARDPEDDDGGLGW